MSLSLVQSLPGSRATGAHVLGKLKVRLAIPNENNNDNSTLKPMKSERLETRRRRRRGKLQLTRILRVNPKLSSSPESMRPKVTQNSHQLTNDQQRLPTNRRGRQVGVGGGRGRGRGEDTGTGKGNGKG